MKVKKTLVNVEIWNEETKHNSGIGRAAVGGMLFGTAGAIVGAATAKNKDFVTFKAEYSDGSVEFNRVEVGGFAHKLWLQNMKMLEKNR